MSTWPQALRLAFRSLGRRPGLAAARLLTIAIVVAATTAVAAIAAATVFKPLPFPDAGRLVQIYLQPTDSPKLIDATALIPIAYEHIDARGPAVESVGGIWKVDRAVSSGGEPDSVTGGLASASFFTILGAPMAIGRTFTDDEVNAEAPVVVLSHGLWTRLFGARPSALGSTMQIDRRPFTIIGVTAADFDPAFTATEFWTPLNARASHGIRATVIQTFGRLRAGATPEAATADLQNILTVSRPEAPELLAPYTMRAVDLRESRYGTRRDALLLLAAVVAALAIIATANLANLTFADLTSRLSDFALRAALGGSTRAIVNAEFTPCVVLALLGAAIGVAGAAIAMPLLLPLDPTLALPGTDITVDWRIAIVGVMAAVSVMTLAVAIPAWRIARRDQLSVVSQTRLTDARGGKLRSWLAGAQTAIALVLLSASTMIVATIAHNLAVDPGFDPSHVVTGQLRLPESAFADHAARVRFLRATLDRLRDTPGIVGAGTTLNLFTVNASFSTNVWVEDAPKPDGQAYSEQYRRVSPGYFDALRIKLLRGRDFLPTDTDRTPLVAIVSDAFARKYWPAGDAIGKRIRRGAPTSPWAEIVGVVNDARDGGLDHDTGPIMYTSYYQGSTPATPAGLVVRTSGDPRAAVQTIKQAIWAVDPAQPLSSIVILDDYLAASLGPQRFRAWLVSICSTFGMVLAVIGIYGVTARSVAERTKEIGIRIAMGGHPPAVWRRMIVKALTAVFAGVAVGALLSVFVDVSIVKLLPDLALPHWSSRVALATIMAAAATAAAAIAAWNAAAVEPIRALRGD
jgi:predicted permease